MNRKIVLGNLKNRRIGKPNESLDNSNIKQEKKAEVPAGDESPYFSPIKTRNQRRHVKIEYENEAMSDSNLLSKFTATTVKKMCEPVISVQHQLKTEVKSELKTENDLAATKVETSKSLKNEAAKVNGGTKPKTGKHKLETNFVPIKEEAVVEEVEEEIDVVKQSKWEPKNWEQMLSNLRKMRASAVAPVDTMGCHKCYDENADEKTQRFHHLVALMLSAQTKDNVTFEAMQRLKKDGLTPENVCNMKPQDLEKLIYPVSFYKNKTKYIQKTAHILIDEYDSDIPNTLEKMMKLPGVGPKMAHLCMKTAWNITSGIGVDTHVHRISNRLKWVPKQTKEPEQTRVALEQWLPFELWFEVNELLVGFGQTICTPTNPKCDGCLNNDICPSRVIKKKK